MREKTPVTGGFPSQRPVMWNVDVFFDLCLNKWLNKQSRRWWFEIPSHSLCHYNVITSAYPQPQLLSSLSTACPIHIMDINLVIIVPVDDPNIIKPSTSHSSGCVIFYMYVYLIYIYIYSFISVFSLVWRQKVLSQCQQSKYVAYGWCTNFVHPLSCHGGNLANLHVE